MLGEKERKKRQCERIKAVGVTTQNMPPQDTPLWHKDYFALKALEKNKNTRCKIAF